MKILPLASDDLVRDTSEALQNLLLDRTVKIRKLNKEMNDDPRVQRCKDNLDIVKAPYKKIRSKWLSEIEAIELELRSRNIKFNISVSEIYEEEE